MEEQSSSPDAVEIRCAECNVVLEEGRDREVTDDGVFCRACFDSLSAQLRQLVAEQGTDVNYGSAFAGALLGAVAGVLAWWGFTAVTSMAFGLVAVIIGVAVGKGVVMMSGGKRHLNLQILSVAVSGVAFVYASYLVNRTFIARALAEEGQEVTLPLVPDPGLLFEVVGIGFGVMDLVFFAIVVYEAWKIPAPVDLSPAA